MDQLFPDSFFDAAEDEEEEQEYIVCGVSVKIYACPDHMQMTSSGAYRRVWPSSIRLAEFVLSKETNHLCGVPSQSSTVIELGAGAGLCGLSLVASDRFSTVLLTDHDERVLRLLKKNVSLYGNRASVLDLDWADTDAVKSLAAENPRLVLGADVTYDRNAIPSLIQCAATLMDEHTILLLALSFPRFASRVDDVHKEAQVHQLKVEQVAMVDGVCILKGHRQKSVLS